MNVECLGYKKTWDNRIMWHYKLTIEDKEYLLIDAFEFGFLDMMWNKKNEFEDSILSNRIKNSIISQIKFLDKKNVELKDDEEKTFFTQHEIVEPEVQKHKGKIYTADEITEILQVLSEFDYVYNENKFKEITQEMSDYADQECSVKDLLKRLVGYKVKFKRDGYHKTDGQMVEYIFTFVSPDDKKSEFATEMCLMVGWNHCDSEKIR